MAEISIQEIRLAMAATVFVLGTLSFAVGTFVLVIRATGKEVRNLTSQTAQLAQKGLAEDVAGLVGNASSLLAATNDLVRSTAGVGVFLNLMGLVLMGVSTWIIQQF
ncbi:MAG TPA: hypothetical protein VJ436_10685 [Anaerolineales bacterium]|nr:hypothetical protein [Anaerolineales bacterium]